MKDLLFLFTSSQLRHVLKLRLCSQRQDTQKQEERKSPEKTQDQKCQKENLK